MMHNHPHESHESKRESHLVLVNESEARHNSKKTGGHINHQRALESVEKAKHKPNEQRKEKRGGNGEEDEERMKKELTHRRGGSQIGAERAEIHQNHFDSHSKEVEEMKGKDLFKERGVRRLVNGKRQLEEERLALIEKSKLINGISPVKGMDKVEEVLEEDLRTADDWIPRSKHLIRLTGPHPLNAESPVSLVMSRGLITPNALHYVRSHGTVPKIDVNEWRLEVSGLLNEEKKFTLDELKAMESINIPVMICCDGNRRKELNSIKHTRGFNFGSGANGCAFWRGVPLAAVLKKLGVKEEAQYVCFEGGDALSKGPYGTSISLDVPIDPFNDVLLAYEMNNEPLPPDHGFPLRVVIPGYVGGRQIKWLQKVTVSDKESHNFYHWNDNKVFPPVVDTPEAVEAGWWYNPDYNLYELNINSVIGTPANGSILSLELAEQHPIIFSGYAYSGGGRKITRVEITLDKGATWEMCTISYAHDAIRHRYKYWSWCQWMVAVEPWKIMRSEEISVRAFDIAGNTQPKDPTWNLLGMLNNCWYTVKFQLNQGQANYHPTQHPTIEFVHPVMPGSQPGGWMIKHNPHPIKPEGEFQDKVYTMDEVKKHNKKDDVWFVYHGGVYDVSSYLRDHPGGGNSLIANGGTDATITFEQIHSADAYECLAGFKIGVLKEGSQPHDQHIWTAGARDQTRISTKPDASVALQPRTWLEVTLTKIEELSSDTKRFTFTRSKKNLHLGLPVGKYLLLGVEDNDKFIVRPYTPISPIVHGEDDGTIKFVIKLYLPSDKKPGGQMSMYLDKIQVGHTMKVRGPAGHVFYHGHGNFEIHGEGFCAKTVSLVAGGSGITPCFQVIKSILSDREDTTEVGLVYSNNSESDILLRKELDELAEQHKRFKLWYTISDDSKSKDWKYGKGRITKDMLEEHLFPSGEFAFAFVCGPPPMLYGSALPFLEDLGLVE
eukprot:TRINITY_DN2177_c0_g3_i1.p1 TRINITY_DN2177_c0_g3~~TRINITY_DN2177_c0_g3_i1.p1  ORF type:complete len:948 (+),score=270.77 TRINITY_DN2177_c0_g3_i1:99-2942(+)